MKNNALELNITYLSVDDLIPYVNNSRTHSQEQILQIAASIKEFGFLRPVLIDDKNTIIAGHGCLQAARKLGMEAVPVVNVKHLSEVQKKLYCIADNKLALNSEWDNSLLGLELQSIDELGGDIELAGFDALELESIFDEPDIIEDGLNDDNDIPDINETAITQYGDIWILGDHRIMCGNSLEEKDMKRLMEGKKANMVFTDPPYNVRINDIVNLGDIKHSEFAMASGEMSEEEFTDFLTRVMKLCASFSKDGSIHYICMDWRHILELSSAGKQAYTELKNICVWNKSNAGMGSFYRSKHELIFVYKNGKAKHINNFELGQHGRTRTNVWDYRAINAGGDKTELEMHPTVKPVEMIQDAILDCSKKNYIVLDVFLGSGSTLIACQKTGRKCYGVEISPHYCDTIIRRFESFTGQSAIHETSGKTFNEMSSLPE